MTSTTLRPFADAVVDYAQADLVPVLVSDNRVDAPRVHALYRHYDRAGTLLYVGITNDPARRWRDHCESSAWVRARLVAWVEVVWFDSAATAGRAERSAIVRECALFNRRRKGMRRAAADRLQAYLDAGAPERAAGVLSTPRRVRCIAVPGTTCVSCGPDAEVLYA